MEVDLVLPAGVHHGDVRARGRRRRRARRALDAGASDCRPGDRRDVGGRADRGIRSNFDVGDSAGRERFGSRANRRSTGASSVHRSRSWRNDRRSTASKRSTSTCRPGTRCGRRTSSSRRRASTSVDSRASSTWPDARDTSRSASPRDRRRSSPWPTRPCPPVTDKSATSGAARAVEHDRPSVSYIMNVGWSIPKRAFAYRCSGALLKYVCWLAVCRSRKHRCSGDRWTGDPCHATRAMPPRLKGDRRASDAPEAKRGGAGSRARSPGNAS